MLFSFNSIKLLRGCMRVWSENRLSRPVRARLDASVDGEARQRRHATWISVTLSRPSRAVTSNSGCSGRWRRRQVTSRRPPNNVTQQTARSSVGRPFELRSSRLLGLSSRLLCSISNVELHCSLESDSPRQNSRADTNCTETDCARSIFARTQLFRRAGDHVTFLGRQHRGETGTMQVTQAARYSARHKHSVIHVHTKLTKIERGNCPLGKRWE